VDFFINSCIGLASLWVEDTIAFQWIYQKAQIVFGGVMLPIALFPEKIRAIAEVLPFSQLFYSGARLMVQFDWLLLQRFVLIQAGWILVFGTLALIMFNRGVRNVSSNGG
jgi:ABC-type uncharacterized transport system permease subunit